MTPVQNSTLREHLKKNDIKLIFLTKPIPGKKKGKKPQIIPHFIKLRMPADNLSVREIHERFSAILRHAEKKGIQHVDSFQNPKPLTDKIYLDVSDSKNISAIVLLHKNGIHENVDDFLNERMLR